MSKELTPHISIVTGTYNRVVTLQRLVRSIRDTIPPPIRYEHIIVDNGSTDETEQWVKSQPDLTFMQLGKPMGAIHAFTKGAEKARAAYVLLATDDITFPANSIMRAYQHLDSHPKCGAVAFGHNKMRNEYRADTHPVRNEAGMQYGYPYPQISLIRRWLGDKCDWWGANTGMKKAFTYGGDNWLGAHIIEYGYTVDVVKGVVNDEICVEDEPRRMNRARHKQDAEIYFAHYPDWPMKRNVPQIDQEDNESLRVLFIAHWLNKASRREKRALVTAWEKVATVWEFDYYGLKDDNLGEYLQNAMDVFKPHLVFSQVHNQNIVTPTIVYKARISSPETVWINWIGDYWPDKVYHKNALLWKEFDALLCVNMDMLKPMSEYTNTYPYLNTYEEPVELPDVEQYDIVFLGNAYSDARYALWQLLDGLRKDFKVGLFGKIYQNRLPILSDGVNHYKYAEGRAIYKAAKLAINTNEFAALGYTGNRFFEIIASGGALCLHQRTPKFGHFIGAKEGTHYSQWNDLADLEVKIREWLKPEYNKRRVKIVKNALRHAQTKHCADARVKYVLTDIVPRLAKAGMRS